MRILLGEIGVAVRTREPSEYRGSPPMNVLGDSSFAAHVHELTFFEPGGRALTAWHVYSDAALPDPEITLHRGVVIIGFDKTIVGLDARQGTVLVELTLGSPFRAFWQTSEVLIVVEEAGLVGLDRLANVLWTCPTDLIDEILVDDTQVALTFVDAQPLRVDLASGRHLPG